MLHNHGHFIWIPFCEPTGNFNFWMLSVECDEKMVVPWQAIVFDTMQNLFDQVAHGLMHQVAIVDVLTHFDPISVSLRSYGIREKTKAQMRQILGQIYYFGCNSQYSHSA